jgi:hypothetical protein
MGLIWRTINEQTNNSSIINAPAKGRELKTVIPSAQTRERGSSIADGLSSLSKLYSEGLLNDEEFSAAKRRLLGL